MYKYLGLMFNDQLSIEQIVAWRAQRVLKKTLIPMRKMLGKKQIPLNLRRQAIIPPPTAGACVRRRAVRVDGAQGQRQIAVRAAIIRSR